MPSKNKGLFINYKDKDILYFRNFQNYLLLFIILITAIGIIKILENIFKKC